MAYKSQAGFLLLKDQTQVYSNSNEICEHQPPLLKHQVQACVRHGLHNPCKTKQNIDLEQDNGHQMKLDSV